MSPGGGWMSYDRRPRKTVEGGVKVPRPGQVTNAVAADLVRCLLRNSSTAIASRGRTYARAGQVVEVRVADGEAAAAIQGTGGEPYGVRLAAEGDGSARAGCTCPYTCDYGWCKHAAALAYVVADLVDRDPAVERAWTGEPAAPQEEAAGPTGADATREVADLLTVLRRGGPSLDGAAQWAAAFEVLPPPR